MKHLTLQDGTFATVDIASIAYITFADHEVAVVVDGPVAVDAMVAAAEGRFLEVQATLQEVVVSWRCDGEPIDVDHAFRVLPERDLRLFCEAWAAAQRDWAATFSGRAG